MNVKSASQLKIVSANVVGLGNISKFTEIIMHLEHADPDIICLIDTRIDSRSEVRIRNHTNYTCHFNNKDSQSRGVAVLIKKNHPIIIDEIKKDLNGNIMCLRCNYEDRLFVLSIIYGPNSDQPLFFHNLYEMINSYGLENHIICGDYNVTLNHELDNLNYVQPRNPRSRKMLLELMEENFSIDCFRELHGNKKCYTWKNWQGNKRARLDMFLSSETLRPFIKDCGKMPEHKSDHNPIFIVLDFAKFCKGKGTWKFQDTLLKQQDYVELINKTITETCSKYVEFGDGSNFYEEASQSEMEEFCNLDIDEISSLNYKINPNLLYEMIMNDIRNATISFSTNLTHSHKKHEEYLFKEINRLTVLNSNGALDQEIMIKEIEYNESISSRSEKFIINSKITNKVEGEKATKFFCNLQKNFSAQRYIHKLVKNNIGTDITITDQNSIEKELFHFYKDLYQNQDDNLIFNTAEEFLEGENVNVPKLCEATANSIEGDLKLNELTDALKKSRNESSPGPNGFTYSFFKVFWTKLKNFLLNSANYSLKNGALPDSLTQGVLSLLPKGDKPKQFLKNWRPITLLNVDYKLISSAIAARINSSLPEIIHQDQCGFIRGRFIGESIRTTYDTLDYVKNKKITALLLILDFKKAFDSVSFQAILKSMSFFGYKESMIKWVKTLLNNFRARINHAGNLSDFFNINRGARQGDPVASLLFIITIEIMAIKIRNSKDIVGIPVNTVEIKLALYADDSNLFLKYCPNNLRNVMKVLKNFFLFSGLEIQPEKSQCVVIGKTPTNDYKLCPELNLIWDQNFCSLGIQFDADLQKMHENYYLKIKEIEKCAESWKYRYLSPYGSICIAKTLLLSKISHLAIVLPSLSKKQLKTLEDKVYHFIWGGTDKVARADAKLAEKKGGLNAPDIYNSWESFKFSWLKRLITNQNSSWAKIFQATLSEIQPELDIDCMLSEIGYLDLIKIGKKMHNDFWKQCIFAIKPLMLEVFKHSPEEILFSPIWGSSLFLRNSIMCKKSQFGPISNRLLFPIDLMKVENNSLKFIDNETLSEQWGTDFSLEKVTEIRFIVSETLTKHSLLLHKVSPVLPFRPSLHKVILNGVSGCSYWSKILKKHYQPSESVHRREAKWNIELGGIQGVYFWDSLYKFNKSISFDNRLKWLNFQITRGTLKVNKIICKFVQGVDELCTFCISEVESTLHLFWNCQKTQEFISQVFRQLKNWPSIRTVTKKEFLFGILNEKASTPLNFLILYCKHYIWLTRCKQGSLTLNGFLNYLKAEIKIFLNCLANYEYLNFLRNLDLQILQITRPGLTI